ncbi:MAG: hypothetical protein IJ511_07140 [Bacteroides sp.]|nr:hypothetical protein [Bacteroides sp.]
MDSLLQQDSLQWRYMYCHKELPDCLYIDGKLFTGNIIPIKLDFEVRRLFKTKADSLLTVLEEFPMQTLTNEADSAYHALLFTEARIKDFLLRKGDFMDFGKRYIPKDSLTVYVTDFFDRTGDSALQTRAHFLRGIVLRTEGKRKEAIREQLIAASYAPGCDDKQLVARIYKYMGLDYYWAGVINTCDSIYQIAQQMAIAQQDTMLLMDALYYRCSIRMKSEYQQKEDIEEELLHGLKLAQATDNSRYQALFAHLLAQHYNRKLPRDTRQAIHYARLAIRMKCPYDVHQLLGSIYWQMGKEDSASYYLGKKFGRNWRQRLSLISTSLLNPMNEGVDSAIPNLQKELQKQSYESFLSRYKGLLIGVSLGAILLIVLLRLHYQRKYRRQSEWLKQQQEKSHLLYTTLQEGMQQREAEIARLQAALSQHEAQAESKALAEELATATKARAILMEEAMKHSPAYTKMQVIIADFRWKEESDQQMEAQDWLQLIDEVNACSDNLMTRLARQHGLNEREVRICCLLMLDMPVAHIAHIVGYTRPVIYKTERDILQKMQEKYEKGKLRNLLKSRQ